SINCEPCVVRTYEEVEEALECQQIILDNVAVPAGLTLKLNLTDGAEVIFRGNTSFGFRHWDGPLVTINGTSIIVRGEPDAIIDGLGQSYWDGQGGWSNSKPQFFTIQAFGGSIFKDIRVINTPKDVVQVTNSDRVTFDNWFIDDSLGDPGTAPSGQEGHNTDGFDVWNSTNVAITNSVVYNQDDCVALRCGANITVSNLFCHGSHGLSISVGFSNDSIQLNTILNVSFADSVVTSGRNGIHVKTHVDGGYGNITGVVFKNITLKEISYNGILIEENYQNKPPSGGYGVAVEPRNNVPIRDLVLEDVVGGVGKNAVPVQIVCAEEGCFNWRWSNVNVTGRKSNNCNYNPEGFSC
ncbi:polygalacturonase-like, partial [Anthonomus grandis grandis]|uniref:polygalacturonase-like n=1 Tax=Anthonomus grandis grandis TaxID=2921223 RepID=UPI002165E66D